MDRDQAEAIARASCVPDLRPSRRDAWRTHWLLWMAMGALAAAGLALLAGGLPVVWAFFGSLAGAVFAGVIQLIRTTR